MKRTYNTFLIAFAVAILFFGVYVYFYNGLNAQAAAPVSSGSAISSQNGTPSVASADVKQSSIDTNFLLSLASLTKIKIDTSIFTDSAFRKLNDNTVTLEQVQTGRLNPFAPVGLFANTTPEQTSPITTNQPVKLTNKTAVLSGTVTSTTGVTNTYFEYGPTPTLGKLTPQATPSLIGTFITTITGLTPQTTYFYRAVAKINGTPLYGEVVSFETQ